MHQLHSHIHTSSSTLLTHTPDSARSYSSPLGMSAIDTALAHAGCEVDPTTGAITPPIHLSSTFERDRDLGFERG
jgi:hypothetical protein